MTDILLGYIDIGVMMQKPSSGRERDLKEHYKVRSWPVLCVVDVCLREGGGGVVYVGMGVYVVGAEGWCGI